jgi:hypothetical protein
MEESESQSTTSAGGGIMAMVTQKIMKASWRRWRGSFRALRLLQPAACCISVDV